MEEESTVKSVEKNSKKSLRKENIEEFLDMQPNDIAEQLTLIVSIFSSLHEFFIFFCFDP